MNELITIPDHIIEQAQLDPILSGYLNPQTQRVGIYFKENLVGFYTPYEDMYQGKPYWRTGNIFVLPEYRNKGLASRVIINFFKDKPYGMTHVAENNPASFRAFEKAGFIKQDEFEMTNPKGIKLQLLLKEPAGLNFGFINW